MRTTSRQLGVLSYVCFAAGGPERIATNVVADRPERITADVAVGRPENITADTDTVACRLDVEVCTSELFTY